MIARVLILRLSNSNGTDWSTIQGVITRTSESVGNSAKEAMKAHVIDARITWVSNYNGVTNSRAENQSRSRIFL